MSVSLPMLFSCQPLPSGLHPNNTGSVTTFDSDSDLVLPPWLVSEPIHEQSVLEAHSVKHASGLRLVRYLCPEDSYNPFASLSINYSLHSILNLFERDYDEIFPVTALVAYFLFYFFSAALITGTFILSPFLSYINI